MYVYRVVVGVDLINKDYYYYYYYYFHKKMMAP